MMINCKTQTAEISSPWAEIGWTEEQGRSA